MRLMESFRVTSPCDRPTDRGALLLVEGGVSRFFKELQSAGYTGRVLLYVPGRRKKKRWPSNDAIKNHDSWCAKWFSWVPLQQERFRKGSDKMNAPLMVGTLMVRSILFIWYSRVCALGGPGQALRGSFEYLYGKSHDMKLIEMASCR